MKRPYIKEFSGSMERDGHLDREYLNGQKSDHGTEMYVEVFHSRFQEQVSRDDCLREVCEIEQQSPERTFPHAKRHKQRPKISNGVAEQRFNMNARKCRRRQSEN